MLCMGVRTREVVNLKYILRVLIVQPFPCRKKSLPKHATTKENIPAYASLKHCLNDEH
jgi:hypothetical protein